MLVKQNVLRVRMRDTHKQERSVRCDMINPIFLLPWAREVPYSPICPHRLWVRREMVSVTRTAMMFSTGNAVNSNFTAWEDGRRSVVD
jgi:hypothetical protein